MKLMWEDDIVSKESIIRKGIDWFRATNHDENPLEQNSIEEQIESAEDTKENKSMNLKESEQTNIYNNNPLFSKDDQDKVVLDLIVSTENILRDRQLIVYKNKDLEEQLYTTNEVISRNKQELMKKDQLLQEKNKEIRVLENNLTSKQMSYDQLLEDYKEYQNNSSIEYEKISNQLETEISKYNKLKEESMNFQHQSILKVSEFEETIRVLETENQHYIQQYEKILDEKSELIKTINDFTERMSFSFTSKTNNSNLSD